MSVFFPALPSALSQLEDGHFIVSRAIGTFLIGVEFVLGSCCQFMMLEMICGKLLFERCMVLPSIRCTQLPIGEHFSQNHHAISGLLVQGLMEKLQDIIKT